MPVCLNAGDYHHNIFYYYRGQSDLLSLKEETLREAQAENNTTKALVNTLTYCSNSVRRAFFEWLGLEPNEDYNFQLQTKRIDAKWLSKATKLVLGIVPPWADSLDMSKNPTTVEHEGSVPDAWLFGKGWVVLVETKTRGALDAKQIASHLNKLEPPKALVEKSWQNIYHFFKDLNKDLNDVSPNQLDQFLLSQFCNYLEVTGMAGFIGLKPEHFEYFVRRDDLELKEAVRNTMNLLASLVGKRMKEQYPEFRMGKISDICRISFFRGKKEGKVAHQTIKLSPYDFEVFANVETQPAVKRLRSNINSNNTTFEKILRELPEGYVVTLTDRVPCDHPRSYNYVRVFEHRTDYLKPERDPQRKGLDYLKSLFFKFTYPQFSIRWRFDKDCVVRRKGNFIEEIVKTMKELHPFVEFSNEGSRSSEFSPAR